MNDVFEFIEKPYSLGTTSHFRLWKIRTTKCGIETPFYLSPPKLWNLRKNKNLDPRELSLQVMQYIYSPNRFYLSSPPDNTRILIKSHNIKKRYLDFYIDIWFFHFWLTSFSFFLSKAM